MPLLNVRLSAEDARLVRALRARGVAISELVRRAIRAEAENTAAPRDTDAIIADMIARFPRPARPRVRATDRNAVKQAIRAKLRSTK